MNIKSKQFRNIIFTFLFLLTACGTKTNEATPQSAVLKESTGTVSVQSKQNEEFIDAVDGYVLNEGGQVQTGDDGRVRLDLSTGTIVRVGPSSLFTLASNTTTSDNSLITNISLELGKLWIILNGGELDIDTSSGLATVRGSYMGITFNNDGFLRLTCLEGTCTFRNETGEYIVPPGFVLECIGPNDEPTITAMTEQDIQEWLAANPEAAEIVAALRASFTPTATLKPTITFTPASTATPTLTTTPTPVASLEGEIQADLLSCRYGPGASYLYQYGFSKGATVEVLGKAETADDYGCI
jgi:hypothetical protein